MSIYIQDLYLRELLEAIGSEELWDEYHEVCEWGEQSELNQFELKLEKMVDWLTWVNFTGNQHG
jgi:hypothetical protein